MSRHVAYTITAVLLAHQSYSYGLLVYQPVVTPITHCRYDGWSCIVCKTTGLLLISRYCLPTAPYCWQSWNTRDCSVDVWELLVAMNCCVTVAVFSYAEVLLWLQNFAAFHCSVLVALRARSQNCVKLLFASSCLSVRPPAIPAHLLVAIHPARCHDCWL